MNHITFQCIITFMSKISSFTRNILITLLTVLVLTGCNQPRQFGITPTNDGSESVATEIFIQATEEEVAKTLTATSTPMAMKVNGLVYPLEDFKNDLLRFMIAFPDLNPEEAFQKLTANLSEQLLLQNAAIDNGFEITDEELDQRISDLITEIGGEGQLNTWLTANYYTQTSFRHALKREIAVAYQKETILGEIPSEVDQVELYQILVYDESSAKQIWQAIADGTGFDWLAQQYHPATRGYIGWSPQGAMLPEQVEQIAFTMEIGSTSDVIQTDYGYHILYLKAREKHTLSPENLLFLQESALADWMETEKSNAQIEIFVSSDQ